MTAGGRARASPSRYLHPCNAVTYASLLAGVLAIVAARELESWSLAGALLAVSALADTLDGRFARLFPRSEAEQRFGVQLDSLADAITFGVVPVAALALLVPFPSAAGLAVWVAAAFAYVVATVTRLGFYDLHHAESAGFVGLPTTVAGLVWSTAFCGRPSAWVAAGLLLASGVAMVSPLPVPRPRGAGLLAFGAWAVTLVVVHGLMARGG